MLIESKPTEYFIYPWQTVTVPANGSASPAGSQFIVTRSGILTVYVNMPSGVTATLTITSSNGNSASISITTTGFYTYPIERGDSISITFTNSNSSSATVVVSAAVTIQPAIRQPDSLYAITINNSQSIATPSNFQQLLSLNLSNIISSPSQLLNLKFCSDPYCTQPLYAWIEWYSSDLSTVYIWVNLPNGVPASSSTTIYMQVTSTNQYPYTGINAYYNTQYDNGANVFDAYMNFMGTSPIPSNYQYYTNISGMPQFVAKSGTTPGHLYTYNNVNNSYDTVYISAPNSARTPEVFEGMAYYNGNADSQGIMLFGEESSGWCDNPNLPWAYILCDSWGVTWDPYYGKAYVQTGSSDIPAYSESLFTSSGYNFYQVIATSNEIIFNGATTNNPTTPYAQLNIQNVFTYSGTITVYGNVVGTLDGSGGATHLGYWYYLRARAYPPNGVMPTVSAITPVTVYKTYYI